MSGADIVALISGIISVISFVLFIFYFVIYKILERSTDKTETTIGHYEKMKNTTYISRGKRVNNNNAIYKYTVNGKTYYQKWDASGCQKAPRQKTITYIERFPRISKVERKNRYYEKFRIYMAISILALAFTLTTILL